MREIERFDLLGEAGTAKISRKRRASVVFPELEGPERPIRSVLGVSLV